MTEGDLKVKVTSLVLGTVVVKFELPMELIDDINNAYDESVKNLPDGNDELISDIKEEKLVNDILTPEIKNTFLSCFNSYLEITKKTFWTCYLSDVWINEMKAGDYSPNHFHSSDKTDLGLSSVLMLKRPSTYGKDSASEEHRIRSMEDSCNGRLEFVGGDQGPLGISQIRIDAQVGEFYVFPYSLHHGVYPFNGTDEARRTMAYNCNLFKPSQLPKEKK